MSAEIHYLTLELVGGISNQEEMAWQEWQAAAEEHRSLRRKISQRMQWGNREAMDYLAFLKERRDRAWRRYRELMGDE